MMSSHHAALACTLLAAMVSASPLNRETVDVAGSLKCPGSKASHRQPMKLLRDPGNWAWPSGAQGWHRRSQLCTAPCLQVPPNRCSIHACVMLLAGRHLSLSLSQSPHARITATATATATTATPLTRRTNHAGPHLRVVPDDDDVQERVRGSD